MNAIICTKYGPPDVMKIREGPKPTPKDDEILIRVHAAAVTVSDCIVRSGKVKPLLWLPMRLFVGFRKPRRSILGLELAGEIEEIGRKINRFKKGDQVIAFTGKNFGAYAEYVCTRENGTSMPADTLVVNKPVHVSYEEAACIPSRGTLALYYLKLGNLQPGQKVLIFGASGGVGSFAVQFASHFGAEVTGVCSGTNMDLVKSLGAVKVIDYTKDEFWNNGDSYDFIFDAVGKRYSSKIEFQKVLTQHGKFISVDDGTPKINIDCMNSVMALVEAGKVKPIIDRCYPMEKIADAHRHVENGHKRGNIVITMSE